MTFLVGVAPSPRYRFPTLLDEPRSLPETFGSRSLGWNAMPVLRPVMGDALPLRGGRSEADAAQ
jgi:cell division protein FtsI (penicillin-binding protein 3)